MSLPVNTLRFSRYVEEIDCDSKAAADAITKTVLRGPRGRLGRHVGNGAGLATSRWYVRLSVAALTAELESMNSTGPVLEGIREWGVEKRSRFVDRFRAPQSAGAKIEPGR